jgi:hypothetical protein
MRRHVAQVWLAAVLAGGCLPGCWGASSHAYPPDPLFASKRPIEAKAENTPATAVSYCEPAVPPVPGIVLAIAQREAPANGTTDAPATPGTRAILPAAQADRP